MMAHVSGQSRYQSTLFPEILDEVVSIDDPVRVIDAFVEALDLTALKFSKVAAEETGRPPYAPGDLLKLYVYGYLHRVRSLTQPGRRGPITPGGRLRPVLQHRPRNDTTRRMGPRLPG